MRYKIQKYDAKGDPVGKMKHVPDSASEVPGRFRQVLGDPAVKAIEIHYTDGTSVEISERAK